MTSPCTTCNIIADGRECPLTKCSEWSEWFVNWWNDMRANVLAKNNIKK